MNKIEEIRLRSRVCERVKEWAEEFLVSEDEIWDALRDFAEYRIALRISEFANSGKVSVYDMCKAMRSLAVEKERNHKIDKNYENDLHDCSRCAESPRLGSRD